MAGFGPIKGRKPAYQRNIALKYKLDPFTLFKEIRDALLFSLWHQMCR